MRPVNGWPGKKNNDEVFKVPWQLSDQILPEHPFSTRRICSIAYISQCCLFRQNVRV
jgi:hypothetical protein